MHGEDGRCWRGRNVGCLVASSSLPVTLLLSRASAAALVRRRDRRRCWRRGIDGEKDEAKLELKLPSFVDVLRLASLSMDQTDMT